MKRWRRLIPAFATSTSSPPNNSSTRANAVATAAGSATSATSAPASPSTSSSSAIETTRAPSDANRRAVAAPIPLVPPVTTTRRPSSRPIVATLRRERRAERRDVQHGPPVERELRVVRPEREPAVLPEDDAVAGHVEGKLLAGDDHVPGREVDVHRRRPVRDEGVPGAPDRVR